MSFYASYPFEGGSGAVPTYANLGAFPSASGAGNGALAIALDTDILYISNGTIWEALADPSYSANAITALTGDGTASGPGSVALTLATVNSNVGSFGTASSVASVTVNGKGLTTAASSVAIQIAESQVTNLVSDLAGKVPTTRTISTTSPLTGGGALSSDLTLAVTSGNLTDAGTDGITVTGGTGAVLGSGTSLSQHVSDSTHNGYLSSTDWSTFNGKQAAGNYLTALTGDVTATGPGSAAASIAATSNATLTTLSALTTASSLATVGTVTSGTWNATTIAINHGGTGQTSASAAFDALAPTTTKGDLIAFSTTNARLPVGSNGQGLVADSAQTLGVKWTAIMTNPLTTLGDIVYEDATPVPTRLAGNITSTKKFLTQTGTGAVSAAPGWNTIAAADLPTVTQGAAGAVASAGQLLGTNTNDNASAGNVGEYIVAYQTGGSSLTVNVYTDLVTITLTSGDWDVYGAAHYTVTTTTAIDHETFISATAGNSSTGMVQGVTCSRFELKNSSASETTTVCPVVRVTYDGTTLTIYDGGTPSTYAGTGGVVRLKCLCSTGSNTTRGKLAARRLR